MVEKRTRDRVWMHALSLARAGQSVTAEQIVECTSVSEQTARDVLNVMSDTAFLERETMLDGTVRYLAGEGVNQQ